VNEALAVMNERSRGDHVGCSLADVLPAAVAEAAAGIIDEVVATRRDRRFEGTFAFDGRPDPRTFTQTWYPVQSGGAVTAVAALVWEITDERSVQAEIAAAGQRFELALSAGGMGTWEWDLRTGVVRWDERCAELFGITPEEFGGRIEDFGAFVHPDDAEAVTAALRQVVGTRGEFRRDFRVLRADGALRWVSSRGRVIGDTDEPLALLGVIQDRTETHSEGERLARTLETMADAFFRLDQDLRFTYVNSRAEVILDRSRDELLGAHVWERFPEAVGTEFQQVYEQVRDTQQPASFEAHFTPLDLWAEVRAHPDDGGVAVYFRDITERRYHQEAEAALARRAQRAHEAAARLLEVAAELHGDRPIPEAAHAACRAGTAVFACDRVALWRVDEEEAVLLAQHGGTPLPPATRLPLADLSELREVVASGEPRFFRTEDGMSPERDLAERVGARAFIYAPVALGGDAGMLLAALNYAGPVETPDATFLDVAGRFAQQTALAIEQSHRREAQHEAARLSAQLQSGLLPIPGTLPERFAIGSYYQPGEQRLLLGGDFSDVLATPDGGLALVIGDVTGHGPEAAAIGAALRAGWRTLALLDRPPAEVLHALDGLVRTERSTDEQLVTVCCARVSPDGRSLLVASAGHLPPLLTTEGGTAPVDVPSGLLLGVPVATGRWTAHRVELPERWAVLLYTDGLPEARREAGAPGRLGVDGFARRLAALEPLAAHDPDRLLRALDADVRERAGGRVDDDVALLLLRHDPEAA
jgi:PAS domain S-box-containing protein